MLFLPGGIAVLFREQRNRRSLLMRRCSLMPMLALTLEKYHYNGSEKRPAHKNENEHQHDGSAGHGVRKRRGLCSMETSVAARRRVGVQWKGSVCTDL